ncbi:questin oxidase family protein [Micromonospora sp. NPDC004540]|uniref:questin oxidase family protein n=1 Tax=Micromonospora sp. NPDC004540 TaxID=3154457 RepID=UPI0033B60B88
MNRETTADALAAAYERLHAYGPEFGGDEEGNHGLTNHGPMAVEVMVRRGLDVDVEGWLDRYVRRLAELPGTSAAIRPGEWRSALGQARRLPDWAAYFRHELTDRPWRDVLAEWWPRLLPGIVAGSTHGVIRVGHAVRTLRGEGRAPARQTLDELAHGLAFWAARYRELAGVVAPEGTLTPRRALPAVTRLTDQSGFIAHRLDRLERSPGWTASLRALEPATSAEEVPARLESLVDSAAGAYLGLGHGSPVLLVHAATAPNAVRHVLPVLPTDQWLPSLASAWAAVAAVIATYAPARPAPRAEVVRRWSELTREEALQRAAEHGDEHVLKFADTAVESYDRTGDPDLLAATLHVGELIDRP